MNNPPFTKAVVLKLSSIAFFSIITAAIISRLMWMDVRRSIIEGLACLIVFSIPFFNRRIQSLVFSLSRSQKKALGVFFFLFVTNQFVNISRTTFPFIPWNMFSKTVSSDNVEFFEYMGIADDGRRLSIKPALVFPSLNNGRIVTDMDNRMKFILVEKQKLSKLQETLGSAQLISVKKPKTPFKKVLNKVQDFLRNDPEPGLDEQAIQLNEMLIALGQMFNHQNPKNRLQSIEVVRGALSINDKPVPKITRQIIWRVQIPE